MVLLPVVLYLLLGAGCAPAEVVNSFDDCNIFFYKCVEPQGMDQNAKKICQKLQNSFHYATLYSTWHRIPLYSAYTIRQTCTGKEEKSGHSADVQEENQKTARKTKWFIEPQLSGYPDEEMRTYTTDQIPTIKEAQAINKDYSNTGYDRGHLNPCCYQCSPVGRNATFTLTNSAPMDGCFNRVHWYSWEKEVLKMIKSQLTIEAVAYLVTGAVPDPNYRIPQQGEYDGGEVFDTNRVTVPSHIWTALCFYHMTDTKKSFSLAFIGQNQPESNIRVMPVPEMNHMLSRLYGGLRRVEIFTDDCFSDNQKSQKMINNLYIHIQLPMSNRLQITPNVMNTFHTAISGEPPAKKPKVTSMNIINSFDTPDSFFKAVETMKYVSETSCLLINIQGKVQNTKYQVQKSNSSNHQAGDSADIQCQLVPEQSDDEAEQWTAADGTYCRLIQVSKSGSICDTGSGWKPRCTTPCLYQKKQKGYFCYPGLDTQIACSPQYSAITVTGKRCLDRHPCATYGYDYYWCYTISDSWDYCSPPVWRSITQNGLYCRPNHACAKYGYEYYWCYTDEKNNWHYCCTHDDRYSAVNGKSCRPNHPCDYYGESYLWCYTTDGSWDKCCTRWAGEN